MLCSAPQALGSSPHFDALIAKAVDAGDELLFKVVRNVAQLGGAEVKGRVAQHADHLVVLLQVPQRQDKGLQER